MSKARRLIELMITVNTKRKFTVKELADEFGVSKRTILRDLQELSEAGIPLYSEVGASGGYQILKEKMLPPISFSEEEAVAMFFAYQSLQYYSSLPFESESISALKKFFHYLPSQVKQRINELQGRITFWTPARNLPVPHLNELLNHAIEQQIVMIRYHSATETRERDIQPIGVYAMNGLWYSPAHCFSAGEIRVFRVDRIEQLSLAADQSRKVDFSADTIQKYLEAEETAGTLPLVVKLNRQGVKRCESEPWLSQSLVVYPDGTGLLQMKMRPDYLPWAARFFLSCGTDAIVEEQEPLRNQMREMITALHASYNQS
ncbi:YafY family transcriptional regulator [Brevibacillus humidisoli]|uniref:helix-turn-helix transcriptional regulator n=1 Tax=Brevibacillus humidisoli TaxID=2895522 RepID=UPI001E53425C|nr:YafY family protein [Brevibacillus humidisoli]UFJ39883.1 YafY family transcriptional regulator [Brevibacillus humidisoli]